MRYPLSFSLFIALLLAGLPGVERSVIGQGRSTRMKPSVRTRRVLYNFDGDSCMVTKAGSKGPVAVTADDVKRLIAEVAFEGSRVDTVLVCINAQVMYYP